MNSTNATYQTLNFWFEKFGFPYLLDSINFYTLTPLSIISSCLNIITYRVLNKATFLNSKFYGYMKINVLNGVFLSLILITSFISSTRNNFEFTNSYASSFYALYVYGFLLSTFLIIGSGLEFLLLIERSLYFSPTSFKKIKTIIESKKFVYIFPIIACLISGVFIFGIQPYYKDVQLDENTWHRIWYPGVTSFSLTLAGNAIFVFAYLIRDILPLILKIALNVYLVNSIRNYTRKLEMEKLAFAQKITFSLQNNEINLNANNNNKAHYNFISKAERNQTYTAIIMSLFSLLEHSFYVTGHFLYFFQCYALYIYFLYASVMAIALKLIGNVLILYLFNSLFRIEAKKYFKFF